MMIKFLIFAVAAIGLFGLFVRYLESVSIFYPSRTISYHPSQIGLAYEDVTFITSDHVRLNGWFVPRAGATATLLVFHGNAGNIGDRLEKVLIFHDLGLNVFIVDYRGYGKSEGKPSEAGLYKDAGAAYAWLAGDKKVPPSRIIVYGESLGGVAATYVASRKPAGALVLDSAFTSAADMAKLIVPGVPSWLLSAKLDAVGMAAKVSAPTLVLHSRDDEIVPFRQGKKMFDAARDPKELVVIRGSHNEGFITSRPEYVEGLRLFLKKHGFI
ncbi:MAG: alpha/beta hydrolase [Candidatus Omnitrophota bacterium]|nr:alpha/beta hydrolase [Candidatus Omnitrophota bacterium]MDZ4243069.1 alpha/beta hydrolase [Candidatus Omnitrophota bacterium]